MDYFLVIMVAVVALMSLLLSLTARTRATGRSVRKRSAGRVRKNPSPSPSPKKSGATKAPKPRNKFPTGNNYNLAPKNPDIMAAALFELLSTKLGFKELISFADFMLHPTMLEKYLNSLKERRDTREFGDGLDFLCRSMSANGFSDEQRIHVAESLRRKANNEFKMLKIQKNMDKIF